MYIFHWYIVFFLHDASGPSARGLVSPGAFSRPPRTFQWPQASRGLCANCVWPPTGIAAAFRRRPRSLSSLFFHDFHWFPLIFNDFHWFSLIFIDFHWFYWLCGDQATGGDSRGCVSGVWCPNTVPRTFPVLCETSAPLRDRPWHFQKSRNSISAVNQN